MNRIKKLIFTLVLPLTIILFGTITKWRYVKVDDGSDDFLYGYPFPFICNGWHTSMSLQIFITELIIDFLVYFLFCLTIVFLIDKLIKPVIVKKYFKVVLYGLTSLTILLYGIVFMNPYNLFHLKKDFKFQEIRSGYKFLWQQDKR